MHLPYEVRTPCPYVEYKWYSWLMRQKSSSPASVACIHLIYAPAAAPLLVATVGCVAEGLKGRATYCITLTVHHVSYLQL